MHIVKKLQGELIRLPDATSNIVSTKPCFLTGKLDPILVTTIVKKFKKNVLDMPHTVPSKALPRQTRVIFITLDIF